MTPRHAPDSWPKPLLPPGQTLHVTLGPGERKMEFQSDTEFMMEFSVLHSKTGLKHPLHIPPVRWWQFWRYSLLWDRDYILMQANEIITIELCAEEMKKEIDQEIDRENLSD